MVLYLNYRNSSNEVPSANAGVIVFCICRSYELLRGGGGTYM